MILAFLQDDILSEKLESFASMRIVRKRVFGENCLLFTLDFVSSTSAY